MPKTDVVDHRRIVSETAKQKSNRNRQKCKKPRILHGFQKTSIQQKPKKHQFIER